MTREQLEHVRRASAAITADTSFVVIGSQAVLLQCPDAPAELLASNEALLKHHMIDAERLESRLRQLDFPSEAHVAWARRRAAEALT